MSAGNVGNVISRRLLELGWTNAEFARRVGETESTTSQWRSGKYGIRRKKILRVAEVLGLRAEDLLTREGEE